MENDSDSIQQAPEDTASTLPGKSAPPPTTNRFWSKLSPWYWAAIVVVGLAMLAKLYQDAPQMPPRSSVATTLAPEVQLRVTHSDRLGAPLRKADSVPVLVELLGSGAVTYTVALSSTPSMVYTDRLQEVVAPRVNLSLDPCCQPSAMLYPQAPPADGLWWQPVTVAVYADEARSASVPTSRFDFLMQREPAWWTFLRRLLLLFADLGLAVAVALAFAGWAFDQQKRRDEQQKWEQQREEQHQQAVWRAQLAHVQQKCQHDLLTGVGELLKLRRRLADDGQDESYRIEVEQLLESFQAMTESKDSPQHERVIEKAVARLKSRHALSQDELEAVGFLLDRTPAEPGSESQSTEAALRGLSEHAQELDPDVALSIVDGLYQRFAYSLAIRDLTVVTIRAWFEGKHPSREEVNERLHSFRYLLHDPRLLDIPFDARSLLYRRPAGETARYPWVNPHHVDEIVRRLKEELGINSRGFLFDPPQFYTDRLPHFRLGNSPKVLRFPTNEDAEYGAHLMYEDLLAQQEKGLGVIDGLSGQDYAAAIASTFIPFPAMSHLIQELDGTEQTERAWLRHSVQALGEEWIKLLACNHLVWSGLSAQERSMLAGLLNNTAGTKEDLYHRLVKADRCLTPNVPAEKFGEQQADHEIIIGSLVQSIERHAQDADVDQQSVLRRMETWLSLHPPHMTHTVVLAVMPPNADGQPDVSWANAARLLKRLRSHQVVVHLFTSQELPRDFSSLAVDEMSVPEHELARTFDYAFGHHQFGEVRPNTSENSTERCKIVSLTRLLDDESSDIVGDFADALLRIADGSPSRLFHIMYDVLGKHFSDSSDESYGSRLAPIELMRRLRIYEMPTP